MKHFPYKKIVAIFMCLMAIYSCEKDNLNPPGSQFTGRVVYNGNPLQLKNNRETVYFEMWQPGFGKNAPISIFFGQDGTFSSLLYDGTYKLIIPPSQGPFISPKDSIEVIISGNKTMDIEVTPYYLIENANFKLGTDSIVTASCSVSQIVTGVQARAVEYIALFVNRTMFVDDDNFIADNRKVINNIGSIGNIQFSAKIPKDISWNSQAGVGKQDYFFARIGLRIQGREDMIFSNIVKVNL